MSSKYEAGMAVRRAVLGDAYVDKAVRSASEFSKPFQEMVTENCWGTVWTREALPRDTRSLITIAMLTALRATQELKLHVEGALRNGCTKEQVREVLMHAAVYCGVPAGVEAFRAANEVITAWEAGQK